MTKVAVMGTTIWGTTLALLLARRGAPVWLWARTEAEAAELRRLRRNPRRLPDEDFPPNLVVTADLAEAAAGAGLIILAVPSQSMRENARALAPHWSEGMLVLNGAKGIEMGTLRRMSQVLAEELPDAAYRNICVLSGPNLALEIVRGLLATSVVAAQDEAVAAKVQQELMSPLFRVYTNTDVIGVEMGGALKNIIALGAGMGDGLGHGHNAKAAFVTRGLAEITRLGVAAGASPLTFAGLAGLGDLIVTCYSNLSRNRHVGQELAKGRPLAEIIDTLGQVAEGVPTTVAARQLAQELGVEMPIVQGMYRVLFEGYPVKRAVAELMERPAKPELAGMGLG